MTKELPRRVSPPGPLLEYLIALRRTHRGSVERVVDAVRACMTSEDGRILLDLLEKSTVLHALPIDCEPRACDARNAQSFIALDLRRIMSDEVEQLLHPPALGTSRRSGRNTPDE